MCENRGPCRELQVCRLVRAFAGRLFDVSSSYISLAYYLMGCMQIVHTLKGKVRNCII